MNKKTKQSLVAGLAAVMGTGIVAPVVNAATQTLPAQYEEAFKATEKAVNSKNQKEMTQARALVDALYANVKGTKNEYLATTLSAMLDPVQQVKLNELFAGAEKADKSLSQADINAIRNLIVDMPEVWKKPYSANLVDPIQQKLITKTVEATKKATDSKLQADKDVAQALLADLKTATNNDGVVAWANGYQSELDKVVVKLEVTAATAVNSTTVTLSGAGLKQLKAEDITVAGNRVTLITPSADEKTATVTLAAQMAPDRESTITVKVGEEKKEFKVKYGYGVTSVTLNEATYDDDRAGQKLTFTVNGQTTDASVEYLALAGYSVNFVATNAVNQAAGNAGTAAAIFDGGVSGSSTGKLRTGIQEGQYNVQMQLIKNGVVTTSSTAKITIANIDANVSAINSVDFVAGTGTYNVALTGNAFYMNSTTLVEGESAFVWKIKSSVNNAEVVAGATDFSVESSNPAVISVNPTTKVITANSKGTAVITVKLGNQTKTFNFTVANDARKLTSITTSGPLRTAVGLTKSVLVETFDQYGDPFKTIASNPTLNLLADKEKVQEVFVTNSSNANLVDPFEVQTDDADSIGAKYISVRANAVGQGTIYFKDYEGRVVGSLYVDVTDNASVNSRKLVLSSDGGVTRSTDNTLELSSTTDNTVRYYYNKYNPNGVSLGAETLVLRTLAAPATAPAGQYSIESANEAIATVAVNASNAATITAVKDGVTDIIVRDSAGQIVEKTTITVTNTPYKIANVTLKQAAKVDYVGKKVALNDVLTVVESNVDDVVEGITLNKSTGAKVRIAEQAGTTTAANGATVAVAVNDLYLDVNNNGRADANDVRLGKLDVSVASNTFTMPAAGIFAQAGIYTGVAGNNGTVIVKVLDANNASIIATSFVVDVK